MRAEGDRLDAREPGERDRRGAPLLDARPELPERARTPAPDGAVREHRAAPVAGSRDIDRLRARAHDLLGRERDLERYLRRGLGVIAIAKLAVPDAAPAPDDAGTVERARVIRAVRQRGDVAQPADRRRRGAVRQHDAGGPRDRLGRHPIGRAATRQAERAAIRAAPARDLARASERARMTGTDRDPRRVVEAADRERRAAVLAIERTEHRVLALAPARDRAAATGARDVAACRELVDLAQAGDRDRPRARARRAELRMRAVAPALDGPTLDERARVVVARDHLDRGELDDEGRRVVDPPAPRLAAGERARVVTARDQLRRGRDPHAHGLGRVGGGEVSALTVLVAAPAPDLTARGARAAVRLAERDLDDIGDRDLRRHRALRDRDAGTERAVARVPPAHEVTTAQRAGPPAAGKHGGDLAWHRGRRVEGRLRDHPAVAGGRDGRRRWRRPPAGRERNHDQPAHGRELRPTATSRGAGRHETPTGRRARRGSTSRRVSGAWSR